MSYVAAVNAIDVSNSNTPIAPDPTNRSLVVLSSRRTRRLPGTLHFIETNAYSGNNARSAILNNTWGNDVLYTAGNAGNGGTPEPQNVVLGAGAQILSPADLPEADQALGLPTPVASFSVTELGDKADKVGKDDNFRGMTVFNNVLYYTNGSGGNGVNTVYYVNTSDTPCTGGVGLPAAGATLPTTPSTTRCRYPQRAFPTTCASSPAFPPHPTRLSIPSTFPSDYGSPTPTLCTLPMKAMATPAAPTSIPTQAARLSPDCRSGS